MQIFAEQKKRDRDKEKQKQRQESGKVREGTREKKRVGQRQNERPQRQTWRQRLFTNETAKKIEKEQENSKEDDRDRLDLPASSDRLQMKQQQK